MVPYITLHGAHGFLTAILLRSGHLRPGVIVFWPGLCLQSVFFSALYLVKFPPPNPTYGKYIVSMLGSTDWQ